MTISTFSFKKKKEKKKGEEEPYQCHLFFHFDDRAKLNTQQQCVVPFYLGWGFVYI